MGSDACGESLCELSGVTRDAQPVRADIAVAVQHALHEGQAREVVAEGEDDDAGGEVAEEQREEGRDEFELTARHKHANDERGDRAIDRGQREGEEIAVVEDKFSRPFHGRVISEKGGRRRESLVLAAARGLRPTRVTQAGRFLQAAAA